jgi:predicted dehydrogenase
MPHRLALAGAGHRAEMFLRAIADHPDRVELVAMADVNQSRMDTHNRWLVSRGQKSVPTYGADSGAAMLERERVDQLIVTSVDRTHAQYIVTALDAGRDVITEKPMTVDADSCRRSLSAAERSARDGALALLTGLAANRSLETAAPVRVTDLLDLTPSE